MEKALSWGAFTPDSPALLTGAQVTALRTLSLLRPVPLRTA